MQLSALESKAYEALRGNGLSVFRTVDVSTLLRLDKTGTYNLIKALKKKGEIKSIKNGLYAFKDISEYVIGAQLNWPSYLSFRSALNYYGFTDNNPKTIYFAATRYHRQTQDYKYVMLSRKRFFGYVSAGDVVIADKEKVIIDSLLFPKYAGGIAEIRGCLERSLGELNISKLVDYALRMESKAVLRRLGFLLEENGVGNKRLQELEKKIGKGYERLDPGLERQNKLNERWLLDVNIR